MILIPLKSRSVIGCIALALFLCGISTGGVIFVDRQATGANDGASWHDAFMYLQDALMTARAGDEIHVAGGVYKPGDFVLSLRPNMGRMETFGLKRDVAVMGGYAGRGKANPDARDIDRYESILSGDLNGDDGDGFVNYDDNCFHVVSDSWPYEYTSVETVLDGFTIRGGNANADEWGNGGGININVDCGLIIRNCTITRNSAEHSGGGMFSSGSGGCASTMSNCRFIGNRSGVRGGALALDAESIPYITNCLFAGNYSNCGGALFDIESYPRITNCTFAHNRASEEGGGAREYGGGLQFRNCILWGNTDASGDGESAQVYSEHGLGLRIEYSCVQGWTGEMGGTGNTGENPLFADLGCRDNGIPNAPDHIPHTGADYHLKSQAGRWNGGLHQWVRDDVTSPCIDAGDIRSPIGREPFPNGGIVNMGVYGATVQASKSYFGGPVCKIIVAGDINGDCRVDIADTAILAAHWLEDNSL